MLDHIAMIFGVPVNWRSRRYRSLSARFGAFGLILTRMAGLGDVRAIGSGNIGRRMCSGPATRVLRRQPAVARRR